MGLDIFIVAPINAATIPGTIIVNNDEWTFTEIGFDALPTDTTQFALNVANWFTNGNLGNFLVYSNNFGLTSTKLASIMTGAGHSWTVTTSVDFTLANLLKYDAIFLAGNFADNVILIDYVNSGGNVYLAGGVGWVGAVEESKQWNTFLNTFGLNYGDYYNNVHYVLPVTSTHPIFDGVDYLYYNNGNSVSEVDPSDPDTDILEFSGSDGLIGIYKFTQSIIEVDIDIKPGSDPNCFNNNNHGTIPIAILGNADFDCTQVDPSTCTLSGLALKVVGKSNKLMANIEDVNNDGFDDLVLHIADQNKTFQTGNSEATLFGNLYQEYGGIPIQGTDSICIVP